MMSIETAQADGIVDHEHIAAAHSSALLTIVIPALNEEESIGSTVQRCLDAREEICRNGRLRGIEVIVVNDGSTDRTSEIAHAIAGDEPAVTVIDFPKNRGYGAALKAGFAKGTGELVSFLDADGTCDPNYFAEMCKVIQDESAAVVLGSRMGPDSEMPRVRRVGNKLFAILLGVLSGKAVTDTASGMRVIQRTALARLYPLPDGLQFTPAMSARAIMDDAKIVEIDMTYSERLGESKLHVWKDGVRFLVAILSALLLFRPHRLFNALAFGCVVISLIWGLYPVEFYLRNARLEETMIYRILLCAFLFSCSFTFISAGVLARQLLSLVHQRQVGSFVDVCLAKILSPGKLLVSAMLSVIVCTWLVWPGLVEYLTTRQTDLHWSRAIVAAFLLQLAVVAAVVALLQAIVRLWRDELRSGVKSRDPG